MMVGTPYHPIEITAAPNRVRVTFAGRVVADTKRALMLTEAPHAPVMYVPREDIDLTLLERTELKTRCPYKGEASYYSIRTANRIAPNAVWSYVQPLAAVAAIAGHMAFRRDRVDSLEQLPV